MDSISIDHCLLFLIENSSLARNQFIKNRNNNLRIQEIKNNNNNHCHLSDIRRHWMAANPSAPCCYNLEQESISIRTK
jgi:hypothetical protein